METDMFDISDETDKFTGDREITAQLQSQNKETPMVNFSATIAGHKFPEIEGTGSYHLTFTWQKANKISELDSLLEFAPESKTEEFNLFDCIIDGNPIDFEFVGISKSPSVGVDEYGNVEHGHNLMIIAAVTIEDLNKFASASSSEFRAFQHEFSLDKDARGRVKNLLSLIGNAETHTQRTNEIISQSEKDEKKVQRGIVVFIILIIMGFLFAFS